MDGRQRKMSALQSLQVPFPQTVRDHVFPHGRLHAGKDNEGPSTHLALCRLTYRAGDVSCHHGNSRNLQEQKRSKLKHLLQMFWTLMKTLHPCFTTLSRR
ncbi:hypothetical protein Bbelb_044910 [Branchiostoma belcheri]|nr:hypothetical protein Bbelb_044910 [Branchiostoma belcheri]